MPTVASFCLIISVDIFIFYLLSLFVLSAVSVFLVAALPFCGPAALGPGHKGPGTSNHVLLRRFFRLKLTWLASLIGIPPKVRCTNDSNSEA